MVISLDLAEVNLICGGFYGFGKDFIGIEFILGKYMKGNVIFFEL